MTQSQSHFIIDVDFSYQYKDLPAYASHNIHVELRPGLDGLEVHDAIKRFIETNFGYSAPQAEPEQSELRCPVTVNSAGQHVRCAYHPKRAELGASATPAHHATVLP